jgi:hypothetical protein
MGWSGGTMVMNDLMDTVCKYVGDDEVRVQMYEEIIVTLQSMDWDCAGECEGRDPAFDRALDNVRRAWCKKRGYDYEEWYGEDA